MVIRQVDSIEKKKQKLCERLAAMHTSTQSEVPEQNTFHIQTKSTVQFSPINEDLQFPAEITYVANFNEGINFIGGKIVITPELLIFRSHSINFGELSDRIFNIKDIVGYRIRYIINCVYFFYRR